MLAVLGAGLGAGILTTTVGVASLLSFPVLLAVGLPPVVANASNTVGLVPAGVSGSFGYRAELREHPRITWTVVVTCALGAVGGAVLLLALPSSVFEAVAPWLILFTCLLVGVQPWVARWLRSRSGKDVGPRTRMGPVTTFFALLTGVYGGYFGAGSGVIMVAVADLDWQAIGLLAAGSVVGGYVGARVGRRLPPTLFRVLVVVAGVVAAVLLLR